MGEHNTTEFQITHPLRNATGRNPQLETILFQALMPLASSWAPSLTKPPKLRGRSRDETVEELLQ